MFLFKKDFFAGLLKGLIIAYAMTFLLLMLLAFLMYKCRWNGQTVDVGIALIYLLSAAFAGFVLGGHVPCKRFLWGCVAGLVYALILVGIAIILNKGFDALAAQVMGPVLLCAAGGMIGGMFR